MELYMTRDNGPMLDDLKKNKKGLELLKTAIAKARCSVNVVIEMDVVASGLYKDKGKTYDLNFEEENNDES
nr:enolase [Tanacetum cinerariifolium]